MRGQGKREGPDLEAKGKREEAELTNQENALDLTWQRNAARACVRTERNDFPVGSPPPPTSDVVAFSHFHFSSILWLCFVTSIGALLQSLGSAWSWPSATLL